MANFDDGVSGYVWGRYLVEVPFPIDKKGREHRYCAMCRYYSKYNNKCQLNGGVCYFPNECIAPTCPLSWEDEEKE